MNRSTLPAFVFATVLAAGCVGRVGYGASATVYGPDLVYVAPGVQVIADYSEPIFYADNFYWRYDGSVWYRSSVYTGGWVYASPPQAVLRIERPHTYVHYRPAGWVSQQRGHRGSGPVVRDHRQQKQPRQAPPRHDRRR